jgi:hypothetical protein
MLKSVRGVFDGKHIRLLEPLSLPENAQVIIIVLDEPPVEAEEELSASELLGLSAASGALDFLNDSAEDIYTDADLKVRYTK